MNLYDPSDGILYVHLSGPADARTVVSETPISCTPLPAGYANRSPGTRLNRRPVPVLEERAVGLARIA